MLKKFALLLLLCTPLALFAADESYLDNPNLTIKELSTCEQQDLSKAQAAYDAAGKELDRVKVAIQSNYGDIVGNQLRCSYTIVYVRGKYAFISKHNECAMWQKYGITYANSPYYGGYTDITSPK